MTQTPRTIIHVPRRFTADEWGGTETVILEISRQQQRTGWRPEIVTSLALSRVRHEEVGGVPVHRYPYCYPYLGLSSANRAAMDKKGGNLLSWSLFLRLLTTPDVRLFHAHCLKRLGGEVRTAARLRRKPLVVSLHGGVFDVPAAELAGMLAPIQNKPEWGKAFGALFGSRRILHDADQVICVGQSELEKARKALPHDRVAYLPNGVDSAKFASGDGPGFRARHGLPQDAFLVLNISRIDAQKNQRLLLEAFVLLRKTHPLAHLLLIGPETQPTYAASLREFITSHGLTDAVRLLPGLRNDDPDLVHAFHACDVFVLPSMHEPFGIVVLEAWSAGKPVIASSVGGLKTLITDDANGWLFDPGADHAATALAKRLEDLQHNPAARHRLGRAGLDEARTRYDWSAVNRQLEELYLAAETHNARRLGLKRS
jgi:glycosyltransferase involved in cell wall biosynthesis